MVADLVQVMEKILGADDHVLAFYEGGSAAFDAKDAYSDYDLMVIVDDEHVDRVAKLVARTLDEKWGVDIEYDVPNPWHGYRQFFFHLEGLAPWTLVDFLLVHRSDANRLNEVERHGRYKVYFDKAGLTVQPRVNPDALQSELLLIQKRIRAAVGLFHAFVDKEIWRKRPIDAMHFYLTQVLARYIHLLRIKFDPHRHDFGSRYLHRDLPAHVAREVESFYFVRDVEDLLKKKKLVHQRIEDLLQELLGGGV